MSRLAFAARRRGVVVAVAVAVMKVVVVRVGVLGPHHLRLAVA